MKELLVRLRACLRGMSVQDMVQNEIDTLLLERTICLNFAREATLQAHQCLLSIEALEALGMHDEVD